MTLSAIITDITSIVTGAMSWATQVVTFIGANPLVEIFVLTSFVGLGIGLVMRLIRG